ncbi:retropepsin-like aspartic protease [Sphingomonas sp. ASV193]|uniref:retropepsin-like aspartic protease n=1 Tax=Sphingomonas sp. ASV193 TaxID=3144405 RepID=UPI0032E8CBFB
MSRLTAKRFAGNRWIQPALLAGVVVSPVSAEAQPTPPAATPLAPTLITYTAEANDRMTVPVMVAGRGPYRFMVDTGANRTALARGLANSLRLRPGPLAEINSLTGASQAETVNVPHLAFTKVAMTGLEAVILDGADIGADGVLGTDGLAGQRIQFDFDRRTMSIAPATTFDPTDVTGAIEILGHRRNGRLVLTNASTIDHSLVVVVDTGAEITVGNAALRAALARRGLSGEIRPSLLISVTGAKLAGDSMILRKLNLGAVSINNLEVVFAPARTFSQLHLEERPALLLGMNALRAFRKVSIDFARMRFRVVPPGEALAEGSQR